MGTNKQERQTDLMKEECKKKKKKELEKMKQGMKKKE